MIADATRAIAERGFACPEVDHLACGPRGEAVRLYAVLGNPLVRALPKFRALATFHEHIFQALRSRQWARARKLIAQCRRISGASQKLYDLHLARIRHYEQHPPAPDWDGAFRSIVR